MALLDNAMYGNRGLTKVKISSVQSAQSASGAFAGAHGKLVAAVDGIPIDGSRSSSRS
jgi:hypothetical protein